MSSLNRMHNMSNPHQGTAKKVLCVCSAGLLRSPTLAWILSNDPFNFNTRAVGTSSEYALIVLDDVQLKWADVVLFVDANALTAARYKHAEQIDNMEHYVLAIPDSYEFKNVTLIKEATAQLLELF